LRGTRCKITEKKGEHHGSGATICTKGRKGWTREVSPKVAIFVCLHNYYSLSKSLGELCVFGSLASNIQVHLQLIVIAIPLSFISTSFNVLLFHSLFKEMF